MGFLRRQIMKWAYISTLGVGVYIKKTASFVTGKSFSVSSARYTSTAPISTSIHLTVT